MGYGAYSHAAHVAMTSARSNQSQSELFTQRGCHPLMDPKGVALRESRDSEAHPNSLAILFALDVSGSMGEIPAKLATDTMPHFMKALLDAGVSDPQVLFMAIGCANGDRAPLQVGQFESTERLMDQWLTSMYLEGGGGGGNESYELALYFAARHTKADCVVKRGHRGYLFITGDEPPNPAVSRAHIERLIGTKLPADIAMTDIIEECQRSYEPFYLIPDPGRAQRVGRAWRDLLGDRVVVLEQPSDTAYVAAGLVALMEGNVATLGELAQRLVTAGLDHQRGAAIARALTPFAASIGKDGNTTATGTNTLPEGDGKSGIGR